MAAAADADTVKWLQAANMAEGAVTMLTDPAQGFNKSTFAVVTTGEIKTHFPKLPAGQLILLERAIAQLKAQAVPQI